MDYAFFRDESVAGSTGETYAFCPNCRNDTPHAVLTTFEGAMRSVQCAICSATHAYRSPRGDVEEEIVEPVVSQKKSAVPKPSWADAIAETEPDDARVYSPRHSYVLFELIFHPSFGLGFVSECLTEHKIEVTFEDSVRILAHGRDDLPTPPAKHHMARKTSSGSNARLSSLRVETHRTKATKPTAPQARTAKKSATESLAAAKKGDGPKRKLTTQRGGTKFSGADTFSGAATRGAKTTSRRAAAKKRLSAAEARRRNSRVQTARTNKGAASADSTKTTAKRTLPSAGAQRPILVKNRRTKTTAAGRAASAKTTRSNAQKPAKASQQRRTGSTRKQAVADVASKVSRRGKKNNASNTSRRGNAAPSVHRSTASGRTKASKKETTKKATTRRADLSTTSRRPSKQTAAKKTTKKAASRKTATRAQSSRRKAP